MQIKGITRRRASRGGPSTELLKWIRIVQLTATFLFITALHVAANTVGQTITFAGRDVPVQKVFDVIEQQTGYVVFYDQAILNEAKPVTLDVKEQPLTVFLNHVLDKQFSFLIKEKTIFITFFLL